MTPNPDSAGEILLFIESIVESHKLDTGIDKIMRTGMAPEDALRMLKGTKLDIARNPSAMLMTNTSQPVRAAKEKNLLGVVPMLRRIDTLVDAWQLDEETEAWLKLSAPSSRVLQWLDEIEKELPRGSSATFVKGRLQRFLFELRDPVERGRRALEASGANSSRDPPPATPRTVVARVAKAQMHS